MRLTYLLGEPGVGKTTLLSKITEGLPRYIAARPFARTIYNCGVVQLGNEHPVFGGTDKLSMSVQPKVLEWASVPDYGDVVAEGDRLANASFFDGMRNLGYELCIVYCQAPAEIVAERRELRASAHGLKAQDEKWVRGRVTKVQNLAANYGTEVLPMAQPLDDLVASATRLPVLSKLWEAHVA